MAKNSKRAEADLAQLQAFVDDGGMPDNTPATTPTATGADDAGVEADDLAQLNAGQAGEELDTAGIGIAAPAAQNAPAMQPSPQRAAALRAGRVPQQAPTPAQKAAQAQAQAQQQRTQQNVNVVQNSLQQAKQAAGLATSGWTQFHDTIANAPAPPQGSIWALVVAIILLIILVYPVDGVPRLGWLWLVLTRRATLRGEDLYGVPTSLSAQEQGWASSTTNLSATQKAAQDIATAQNTTATAVHAASQEAVNTTRQWLNDTGLRVVSRYVPGA